MKYTHILFDADDTLLDFQKAEKYALLDTLKSYNIELTNEIYATYQLINHELWSDFERGKVSKEFVQTTRFEKLFSKLQLVASGEEGNEKYQSFLCCQTWLVPHAKDVCEKLSKDAKLVIVTNGVGKTQEARIRNSALSSYITELIVSENIGYQKPDLKYFEYTFKTIGISPLERKNVLLVGDSMVSDIQGAINAGIDSCWFNPKKSIPCQPYFPTFTIDNLIQLLDIVN